MPIDKEKDTRYDRCPICGEWKRTISKTCRKCRFFDMGYTPEVDDGVNYDLLTPEWLHEFRGLFWGEGSAMIVPNGSTYGVILQMWLRADDKAVILDIQHRLGGRLLEDSKQGKGNTPNAKPTFGWKVADLEQVAEICRLLLNGNLIPAKKVGDVERVLAFCEFRIPNRFRLISAEEKKEMKRMHRDLINYRKYREVD